MNMSAQMNAYIHSEDSRTQAAFYVQALGGEIRSVMTFGQVPGMPEANKDKVMHMMLAVAGENVLFLSDSFGQASGGRAISLALAYGSEDEARVAFGNLAKGGAVKFPFELQTWGAYYGEVEDKFGIKWQIVKQ
jgi:PhnB protein